MIRIIFCLLISLYFVQPCHAHNDADTGINYFAWKGHGKLYRELLLRYHAKADSGAFVLVGAKTAGEQQNIKGYWSTMERSEQGSTKKIIKLTSTDTTIYFLRLPNGDVQMTDADMQPMGNEQYFSKEIIHLHISREFKDIPER